MSTLKRWQRKNNEDTRRRANQHCQQKHGSRLAQVNAHKNYRKRQADGFGSSRTADAAVMLPVAKQVTKNARSKQPIVKLLRTSQQKVARKQQKRRGGNARQHDAYEATAKTNRC